MKDLTLEEWNIRKTRREDLPQVMEIYARARAFMRESGNPHQWQGNHPPEERILEDIRQGKSHVCTYRGEVVGVFYFAPEEVDPTYVRLVEGDWLEEGPYGVIHRIAVGSREQGVASRCLDWCWERCKNIRIDTHEDNRPMRRFLEKKGFRYCGVVRLENGSLRLGYQKTLKTSDPEEGSHGE